MVCKTIIDAAEYIKILTVPGVTDKAKDLIYNALIRFSKAYPCDCTIKNLDGLNLEKPVSAK